MISYFFDLGLKQCQQIRQLFHLHSRNKLVLVVAKLVDDIKVAEKDDRASTFIINLTRCARLALYGQNSAR